MDQMDLPFQMKLYKIKKMYMNNQDSLILLLIMEGQLTVCNQEQTYVLQTDDILLVSPFEHYEISSEGTNLLLCLEISTLKVKNYYPQGRIPIFSGCSCKNKPSNTKEDQRIRETLARLMATYFKESDDTNLEMYQYLFQLLSQINHQFKKSYIIQVNNYQGEDEGFRKILKLIQERYDQSINLKELALENGWSYYHLSREFKKQLSINFTEYLNRIRLEKAEKDLITSNLSITQIAMKNGFANVKSFYHQFKKQHQQTPKNFREQNYRKQIGYNNQKDSYKEISGSYAQQELAVYLAKKEIEDENTPIYRQQSIDLEQSAKRTISTKKIIKLGYAEEGLSKSVQEELSMLQEELHFDYIQFEGFCQEKESEDRNAMISAYILNNQLFDFLLKKKLCPMIQFSVPKNVKTKEAVELWCQEQLAIVKYFVNRYGYEQVSLWTFQWIQPEDIEIWEDLSVWGFNYFFQKLKQFLPTVAIGLHTLDDLSEEKYKCYLLFLSEQARVKRLPDFLCYSADPYQTLESSEKYAFEFKKYQKDIFQWIQKGIEQINEDLKTYPWRPEVYLTEWNTLVGVGNTLAGTFFRSALIIEAIIELSSYISGIGFWLNIRSNKLLVRKNEENSLSVFLYEKLRRPLYFALMFFERLSGEVVYQDFDLILTKRHQKFCLLIYNSCYINPIYSLDSFQVNYQVKKIQLFLENFPFGAHKVRHYFLDKDHGGIYNDWLRTGGDCEMDSEMIDYLERKIYPKLEVYRVNSKSQTIDFEVMLSINGSQLIEFIPIIE